MTTEYTKISDRIAGQNLAMDLLNKHTASDTAKTGLWFQITSEAFTYFRDSMEPRNLFDTAFELADTAGDAVSEAYMQDGPRFYCLTIERGGLVEFESQIVAFRRHLGIGAPACAAQ